MSDTSELTDPGVVETIEAPATDVTGVGGPAVDATAVEVAAQADAGCCGEGATPQWGYTPSKKDHLTRLRRIEGQTRGLQRMIENDAYCIDILTQISAVTSALESLSLKLLEEHLNHCVAHAIETGGEEARQKLDEANKAIARLVRS